MAIPAHTPDDTFVQLLTPEGERVDNADFPLEVSDDQLRALYDLLKWAPTSANSSPARFQFVRSAQAKERLMACTPPANAPVLPPTAALGKERKP